MALKKETIQKIATILKMDGAALETAIKDINEVDVAIDDKLQVFTEPEVTTLKNNEYTRGKDAGIEMEIKTVKGKLGLDFSGKSVEGLMEAYKTKVIDDAKITPDAKVKELETKNATLTSTVQDLEKKIADKDNEVTGIKINGELYKHIPAPGDNGPALGADDIITLMKSSGYEFKMESGTMKAYKGGQLVADKLGNAVTPKDVVTGFITEKKLVSTQPGPGGRGGDDKIPPSKFTKLSELKAKFVAENKNLQGQEFSAAVQEASKDKDFDMNS